MGNKTFNIYCDESTHLINDGQPYMIYGYVCIAYNQMSPAKEKIKEIKEKYGYADELKWTNISDKTYPVYSEIIDYFFNTDMSFRAVVVDKAEIDDSRENYTYEDFYFRMYFQLLHHKTDMENTYNIYFDIKDNCSQSRLHKLRDILKYSAAIRNFQFIRSHECCFVQLADVLMGAINYHLRMDCGTIAGNVVAKKKMVEKVKQYTHLSLECTTARKARKFNLFFISLK